MKFPSEEKYKEKVKRWRLSGLIAFDIHSCLVCSSCEFELCKTGQSVGLGADEQRRAACQRKGIVGIRRFRFDHDEGLAGATFLYVLQGECGGRGIHI